jgi:hypothetical protein
MQQFTDMQKEDAIRPILILSHWVGLAFSICFGFYILLKGSDPLWIRIIVALCFSYLSLCLYHGAKLLVSLRNENTEVTN